MPTGTKGGGSSPGRAGSEAPPGEAATCSGGVGRGPGRSWSPRWGGPGARAGGKHVQKAPSGKVSWVDSPVLSGWVSGLHVEASRAQVGRASGVGMEVFSERSVPTPVAPSCPSATGRLVAYTGPLCSCPKPLSPHPLGTPGQADQAGQALSLRPSSAKAPGALSPQRARTLRVAAVSLLHGLPFDSAPSCGSHACAFLIGSVSRLVTLSRAVSECCYCSFSPSRLRPGPVPHRPVSSSGDAQTREGRAHGGGSLCWRASRWPSSILLTPPHVWPGWAAAPACWGFTLGGGRRGRRPGLARTCCDRGAWRCWSFPETPPCMLCLPILGAWTRWSACWPTWSCSPG